MNPYWRRWGASHDLLRLSRALGVRRVPMTRLGRQAWGKFRFGLPILRAKLTGRPFPFQVQFTLTNRCNLKCQYCYADYPHRPDDDLSTEQVLSIIDALGQAGTRRFNLVGGEPLVRQDIGAIIAHVKGKGYECAMTTNGYYVRKRLAAVRMLDLLCISLDGDRQAHDKCRGSGSFDKAMEAIELAIEHRVPLQAACVLTKYNLRCIEYVLDLAGRYGFTVGFSTLIAATGVAAGDRPHYLPTDEEYREALARLLRYKQQGRPVLFSTKSLAYALHWPLSYGQDKIIGVEPSFDYIRCNAGRYFAIVDANGDLYPCPATVGVLKPLNILRDGLDAALHNVRHHPCRTCHIPCQNDFNLLYSLNPGVILNILRNYRPRSRQTVRPAEAAAPDQRAPGLGRGLPETKVPLSTPPIPTPAEEEPCHV